MLGVKGSFFQTLLDINWMNRLSKISYGIFLVHGMVIIFIINTKTYDTYLSIIDVYVQTLATIVISLTISFLLTLFIELPCRNLTKIILFSLQKETVETNNSAKISILSEDI